ncbi:MAG: hypothetical protein LQ338_004777 [Usnochroma carphineum]|nr:MAG: hypothetical protein LQ338_004777 [Usnochroma carphineum]
MNDNPLDSNIGDICEVGLAWIDTRDIAAIALGANGEGWKEHTEEKRGRLEENLNARLQQTFTDISNVGGLSPTPPPVGSGAEVPLMPQQDRDEDENKEDELTDKDFYTVGEAPVPAEHPPTPTASSAPTTSEQIGSEA